MAVLYHVAMWLYGLSLFIAAPVHPKAARWVRGRKGLFRHIDRALGQTPEKRIWFHCASLGEFELARPLISEIKKVYKDHKIVLTFFSPSGYEQVKDTSEADHVFYLPLDGPLHARRFVRLVSPEMVFLVKNDLWYFYIRELRRKKIPVYTVSVRFHRGQFYFHWYGRPFQRLLKRVSNHFVVDQRSLQVMYDAGLVNVTVCGDLRFDRVAQSVKNLRENPAVKTFCENHTVLVAGSTWPPDEKLLAEFFSGRPAGWRMVIAPHEVHETRISALEHAFSGQCIRYSALAGHPSVGPHIRVLIVDNIGMLATLYRYGQYAYVGGAFGKGLHNILEAVAFGLPVFFGPRIRQFPEAQALVDQNLAFIVKNAGDLAGAVDPIVPGEPAYTDISGNLLKYIEDHQGATRVIMSHLEVNKPIGRQ